MRIREELGSASLHRKGKLAISHQPSTISQEEHRRAPSRSHMLDAIKLPPTLLSIRDSTILHHLNVVKIDSTNPGRAPFIRGPMLTRMVLYGRQANKMKRGYVINSYYFFLS